MPPNSTVEYELELVSCGPPVSPDDMSMEECVAEATKKKERGNYHMKRNEFDLATAAYGRATKMLQRHTDAAPARALSATLHSNMTVVLWRLGNFERAQQHADETLKLDEHHTKALYYRGCLALRRNEAAEALKYLSRAQALDRASVMIREKISEARRQQQQLTDQERRVYRRMMDGISDPLDGRDGRADSQSAYSRLLQRLRYFQTMNGALLLLVILGALLAAVLAVHIAPHSDDAA